MDADIELYKKSTGDYNLLQHLRPDYTGAESAFLDLCNKYLQDLTDITVADFCCGTGVNTNLLSKKFSIKRALLIDINKEFLDIAQKSDIHARVEIISNDILNVDFPSKSDIVISMFAYHHVPDDKKDLYISQIKKALRSKGLVFLGEIYSPNPKITIDYYKYLYDQIPNKSPELEKFLNQTATSDNFEYKVSRKFAHDQFISAGFKLIEFKKIWPLDSHFDNNDVGTFVEVWQNQ